MEEKILEFYHECEEACEAAEKALQQHKNSDTQKKYAWCFAQVMTLSELMDRLDIDYDDIDDFEEDDGE